MNRNNRLSMMLSDVGQYLNQKLQRAICRSRGHVRPSPDRLFSYRYGICARCGLFRAFADAGVKQP